MPQLNKQNISCSLPHGNITHSNMKYQQNMISCNSHFRINC